MIPRHVRRLLPLAAAALLACEGDATGPAPTSRIGALEVTATQTAIHVKNSGGTLARFFLVNASIMPLALFAPCDSTCTGVDPGDSVAVPVARVNGWTATAREVFVTYWLFAPGPNDRVDASITSGTLRIP